MLHLHVVVMTEWSLHWWCIQCILYLLYKCTYYMENNYDVLHVTYNHHTHTVQGAICATLVNNLPCKIVSLLKLQGLLWYSTTMSMFFDLKGTLSCFSFSPVFGIMTLAYDIKTKALLGTWYRISLAIRSHSYSWLLSFDHAWLKT